WDIVEHIISEFTAGRGARDIVRTVFAVGDEKQSIFSFQGAAPREFDQRRRELQRRFGDAGLKFDQVAFTYSFRSGATILQSVDHVFREEAVFRSIHSADIGYPIHHSLGDAGPSLIDFWQLEEADDKKDIEGWRAPFDGVSVTSPEVKLSRRIQAEIKRLVASGTMTGPAGNRRRLSFGDVLILVRRRGNIFDAAIQALKHAGIPVAGADRLKLTEHIAIIDLMNLADALLLPQDDLALTVALKSPLFGLDDDDLFALAFGRKGSLRKALGEHAATSDKIRHALSLLEACERRFAASTPFAFYAWLLGGDGGRARILKRLGHEANDALDEFLELALNYERKAPASLQGFVAWLRAADTEVKRDMEISRDEVRVMTVHGAKGLEAPIVILADTTTPPAGPGQRQPRLLDLATDGLGIPGHFVWAGPKANDVEAVAAARERVRRENEDEHARLLYVAMTRAIDRLVVCGAEGERGRPEGCWWNLVSDALRPVSVEEPADDGDGNVWRYRPTSPRPEPMMPSAATTSRHEPPSWLERNVCREPLTALPLSPSRAYDEAATPARDTSTGSPEERGKAMARGVLLHRLLQSLPDIPRAARAEAALRYLARAAGDLGAEEQQGLLGQVQRVLADARFSELFLPGSRAEVPIVGRLKDGALTVSGQVDRLAVINDAVLISDYKTNRPAPRRFEDVPPAYIRQLALYRAVLAQLYPDKLIRAALLWTDVPDLMEIPASAMDRELAAVTSA
ncbi:MAG: 3'-5' exonuclease, partial [Xanthobacteraceae bacterium]